MTTAISLALMTVLTEPICECCHDRNAVLQRKGEKKMHTYYVITVMDSVGNHYSYAMSISDHENMWPILKNGIRYEVLTLNHFRTKKEAVITAADWNTAWARQNRLMDNPSVNSHVIWR